MSDKIAKPVSQRQLRVGENGKAIFRHDFCKK